MKNFGDIKSQFRNGQNEFNNNVKDNVGVSINDNILEPISQSISNCIVIENNIEIELLKINKLLVEARSIIPKY